MILERVRRGSEVDGPALQRNLDIVGHRLSPVGLVARFALPGGNSPEGWILCDGRAVSRSENWQLFTVIGTAYGVGDGSTTFNVPSIANTGPSSVPWVIRT